MTVSPENNNKIAMEERRVKNDDHSSSPCQFRWAVDVSRWQPNEDEFEYLCSNSLTKEESVHCKRFKFEDDRKRALISKLLQRTAGVVLASHVSRTEASKCNTSSSEATIEDKLMAQCTIHSPASCCVQGILIGTTKGRKPYLETTKEPFRSLYDGVEVENMVAPNFNYNVSHDGHYVVLASEGFCVCGCDVSSPQSVRKRGDATPQTMESLQKVLRSFDKQLTPREWKDVYSRGDAENVEQRFMQYWSLKEAFVKAIGMGLGYDLGLVEFDIDDVTNTATLSYSEEKYKSHEWSFNLHSLPDGHWVSVARGPPTSITDAHGGFTETFRMPTIDDDSLSFHLHQVKEPSFEFLTVEDILSLLVRSCAAVAGSSPCPMRDIAQEYVDRFIYN